MRRVAAIGSFLALVTGCGEPARQEAARPPAPQPPPTQQPSAGYSPRFEWLGGNYEGRGGLAFAIPETDAVGVGMECRRGSRSVRVSTVDPDSAGTTLTFGSGETQATVDASPSHDTMIDDSTYAAAIVDVDHPVLHSLQASGELWVWHSDFPMRAESEEERKVISDFFFVFCGARPD